MWYAGCLDAVARDAVIRLITGGLSVSGEAAPSVGEREVWAGALPRQMAEAVASVTLCWLRSARADPALHPADADRRQSPAEVDGNGGGGHLSTVPSSP